MAALQAAAERMGANAIVGVSIDSDAVADKMLMVSMAGTAVVLE
jgi:uncharacterized protein YbjQ (UPF0145 family)